MAENIIPGYMLVYLIALLIGLNILKEMDPVLISRNYNQIFKIMTYFVGFGLPVLSIFIIGIVIEVLETIKQIYEIYLRLREIDLQEKVKEFWRDLKARVWEVVEKVLKRVQGAAEPVKETPKIQDKEPEKQVQSKNPMPETGLSLDGVGTGIGVIFIYIFALIVLGLTMVHYVIQLSCLIIGSKLIFL